MPTGFNKPYRDIIKYIKSYTIEELGNVLWLAPVLFSGAPAGFQRLFFLLRPALVLYMCCTDAEEPEVRTAVKQLHEYLEAVDWHVRLGQARLAAGCLGGLAVCAAFPGPRSN